ncbi:MAG: 30S ribosomal protein S18 [Armatimonadetes bacterium]|nr:30S ribosomal protein S18 [Armatimonadota bacterium]
MDKDSLGAITGDRPARKRSKKKISYLTINKIFHVDYKEVNVLRRFLNEHGKILSTKVSGNTAKQQRMITTCVKRAREMALLPFVISEPSTERYSRPRREGGPRRDEEQGSDSRGGDRNDSKE